MSRLFHKRFNEKWNITCVVTVMKRIRKIIELVFKFLLNDYPDEKQKYISYSTEQFAVVIFYYLHALRLVLSHHAAETHIKEPVFI